MSLPTTLNNSKPGFLAAMEILASAARTAAPADVVLKNLTSRCLMLFINVSATAATPTLTVTIKGTDPISGLAYTILASAGLTGTGLVVLRVTPDLAASANLIAQTVLPQDITISFTHGDSDSITYSVAAVFLPA